MNRSALKPVFLLIATLVVFGVILAVQHFAATPQIFRGRLLYPAHDIGGEGGEAKLTTAEKTYDLFFPDRNAARPLLEKLAGKRVLVLGHSRLAHGIERHAYPAIDVVRIAEDTGP